MLVFEYGCENVLKEKLTKSCKVFPQRVAIQLRTQLVEISQYQITNLYINVTIETGGVAQSNGTFLTYIQSPYVSIKTVMFEYCAYFIMEIVHSMCITGSAMCCFLRILLKIPL